MTERRRFMATAGRAVAAVTAAAIVDAPNVIAQPEGPVADVTAWPPASTCPRASPTGEGGREMSGRFRIEVFAAGQIMPDFGASTLLRRARSGVHGSPQYWKDKEPAIDGLRPSRSA
jgi:TRAP-type mannitol/chloroaromatic compound transport system substrate-binding protein